MPQQERGIGSGTAPCERGRVQSNGAGRLSAGDRKDVPLDGREGPGTVGRCGAWCGWALARD